MNVPKTHVISVSYPGLGVIIYGQSTCVSYYSSTTPEIEIENDGGKRDEHHMRAAQRDHGVM